MGNIPEEEAVGPRQEREFRMCSGLPVGYKLSLKAVRLEYKFSQIIESFIR